MASRQQQQLATRVRKLLRDAGETPKRIVSGGYALRNKQPILIDGFQVDIPLGYQTAVRVRWIGQTDMLPWHLIGREAQIKQGKIVRRIVERYAATIRDAGLTVTVQGEPHERAWAIVREDK